MKLGYWLFLYIEEMSCSIEEIARGQYQSVFDHPLFMSIRDLHDKYLLNFGLYINADESFPYFSAWAKSYFEELSLCNWIKWGWHRQRQYHNNQDEKTEDIASFAHTCNWIEQKFGKDKLLDIVMMHHSNIAPYFKVFHDFHIHIILLDEGIIPDHFSEDIISRWNNLRELSLEFIWRKKDIDFNNLAVDVDKKTLVQRVSQLLDENILNNIRVSISEKKIVDAYDNIQSWLDMLKIQKTGSKTKAAVFPNTACIHSNTMYFSTHRDNYIYKYDMRNDVVSAIDVLKSETIGQTNFSAVYYNKGQLIFTPCISNKIVIYDLNMQTEVFFPVPDCVNCKDGKWNFIKSIMVENSLWFVSARELKLIQFELDTYKFHIYTNWPAEVALKEKGMPFSQIQYSDDFLYLFPEACNTGVQFDLANGDMTQWRCACSKKGKMIYKNKMYQENESAPVGQNIRFMYWNPLFEGQRIYFSPFDADKLLYLDIQTDKFSHREIFAESYESTSASFPRYASYEMLSHDGKIFLIPMFNNLLISYDIEQDSLSYIRLYRNYEDIVAERIKNNIQTKLYFESDVLSLNNFFKLIKT